ncbi:MAG TPA: hypothetical protein PLF50_01215 [Candidatus Cloacimonadota bacterium]|nr:hypothetical protein [Candidatus Cloacimonadota bacterium]HOV16111.1 hypothetical protein [Candidatus Cloacimonadota bacterium]HQL14793.1 hypothetical protein [Candidatus Cloacimonadota bacterium]
MTAKKFLPFILLLLGCLACISCFASEQQNGSIKYAAHDSIQAKLLQMEQAGIRNADLYNQIGLSYYHQGKIGQATLYFLRALRLESNHKAARNNLNYVINLSPDKELYPELAFLPSLFQNIFNFLTLNMLAIISLLLLVIVTLCLHWLMHLKSGQDKAVPILWLIIFGFLFLASVTLTGLKIHNYNNKSKAVIIETETAGYSGPGEEYGKLFTVHAGLIVQINRINKDWALVTLPNGGAGWVRILAVERVNP